MLRSTGVVLAAILVISLPVVGAVYMAHRLTRDAEFQRVGLLARAVLGRTITIGNQSQAAIDRLNAHRGDAPCSPANLALMREIDMGSSYLQAVGHVANDRLMCSSVGDHGAGIPIGPVRFVNPRGDGIRPRVRLPMVPGTELMVADRDGSATVLHPDLVTDVVGADDGIWVGVINLSHRVPLVARGYRPAWAMRAPAEGGSAYFIDGDRTVAMYRPAGLDYATYAAAPLASQHQQARALAWKLGPLGALAGVLLWLALRWQMRQLASLPAVMRAALARDEFFVEYQPIVELATGHWTGAEVLVRWRRPDGSMIRPDVFIPVAEASDIICLITKRVVALVGREAPALLARCPDFRLSINLSAADLATASTVRLLRELAHRPGFAPRNIAIEATERGLLDAQATLSILEQIRGLGMRAAIDDFGTGYSGLSYLGTFEIDALKIDKSFIDTIGTDAPTSNVAVHIIEMAKALGLDIVAEGIENAAQAAFLRERGVQYGQGWLFARSMSMAELLARVDAAEDAPARATADVR